MVPRDNVPLHRIPANVNFLELLREAEMGA